MKPGPNDWSASTDNVWVDGAGQLHLRITRREGKWYAAEVTMLPVLGYGRYVFYVASRVDQLDKNLVVGLFVYENDTNEIDIEFSHWGSLTTPNSQYVVQPRNAHWFSTRLEGEWSTHGFIWTRDSVSFRSLHGHHSLNDNQQPPIAEWVYRGYIPRPGAGRVHINLWLHGGRAPSDNKETELIVKKFEFVPSP